MRFLMSCFTLILVSLGIIAIFFPAAVLVHEATHSLLYSLEGVPVTSFHVLDPESVQAGRLGFITTPTESRYGSFFQEIIATITTSLFMVGVLLFFLLSVLKKITLHQVEHMGVHRSSQ